MKSDSEWFENWFDSPYYPILYQNRDEEEASFFLEGLFDHLFDPKGKKVLDLACGKGRYSRKLNQLGCQTFGFDLSSRRIAEAKSLSSPDIDFRLHDMRLPFPVRDFDLILNLFTSFGYFSTLEENEAVLRHCYEALLPGAYFILDYLNVSFISRNLITEESKSIREIDFQIRRYIEGEKIFKEIKINDREDRLTFVERIQAFREKELKKLLNSCGFHIKKTWGNYQGHPFHPLHSPRLVIFSQKLLPE